MICNLGAGLGQDEPSQYCDNDDGTKPNMIISESNEANEKPTPRNRRKTCVSSNNEGSYSP